MLPKFILALRKYSDSEVVRWYGNTKDGEGVTLTYSFNGYSASDKAAVKKALKAWSSVANITFNETASKGDFEFKKKSYSNSVLGEASRLITWRETGSLIGSSFVNLKRGMILSSRLMEETIMHEVGHLLGLDHPFEGQYRLRGKELDSSVMSYRQERSAKLGVIDIAAMQSIYGPAKARLGGNTYKLGTSLVWDGGGTDTLSAASAKAKAYINLNDGSWSWIGRKTGSILDKNQTWIGHFSDIENAVGTRYNDTIIGNELANVIKAGKGHDKVSSNAGDDVLYGQGGNDSLDGGAGNDLMAGGTGHDCLIGGTGDDRLYGESGNDKLYGGVGNDTLDGGTNNDILAGEDGDDTLYGQSGSDRLYGGAGNDTLDGGSENDLLYGEVGDDSLLGSAGNDQLQGGIGNDTLDGGSDADVLAGGLGADVLTGGVGNDTFVFSSFEDLGTLDAFDAITDLAEGDVIDLRALHATFLGEGADDTALNAAKAGQFYFNTAAKQLRFDADGDSVVDHILGLNVATLPAGYLILA